MRNHRYRSLIIPAMLVFAYACEATDSPEGADESTTSPAAAPPVAAPPSIDLRPAKVRAGLVDEQGRPATVDSPLFPFPFDPLADDEAPKGPKPMGLSVACPNFEGFEWRNPSTLGTPGADVSTGTAAQCNGMIEVGYTSHQIDQQVSNGGFDMFVRMLGQNGVPLWTKQLGTSASDQAMAVTVAHACNNDAIYVAGYSNGNYGGTNAAANSSDATLTKFEADGRVAWKKQFGVPGNDQAFAVAMTPDGDIVVAGSTAGNLANVSPAPASGTTSMFVSRFSPDGIQRWTKQLFADQRSTIARGVSVAADGSIIVTGYTNGGLNGSPRPLADEAFVVRYSNNGVLQAYKPFGTALADRGWGIVTAQEGGATFHYIMGYTVGSFLPGFTNPNKRWNAFLRKLNANFDELWTRQTTVDGGNVFANGIALANGTVLITGSTAHDVATGAPLGFNGLNDQDMLLWQHDTGGNLVRTEYIGTPAKEAGYGVAVDPNGNFFVTGQSDGTFCGVPHQGGGSDVIPVKIANGCRVDPRGPTTCRTAGCWGDPHYATFDGLAYDFQAAGDFVMAKQTDNPGFEIQIRQCPTSNPRVAVAHAVGARVGSDIVEIHGNGTIYVNGQPSGIPAGVLSLAGGGSIYTPSGGGTVIGWPSGERLLVRNIYSVNLIVPLHREGKMLGLLGDMDGNRSNEFMLTRDGDRRSDTPLTFQEMYRNQDSFASVWRVATPAEALIKQGTDCTDETAPGQPMWLNNLTPQEIATGEAACVQITDPVAQQTCIFDVGLINDQDLATASNEIVARRNAAGLGPLESGPRSVYFNDFQGNIGAEWSSIVTSSTPLGDRSFMGPFYNETVNLSLYNLGPHTELIVGFDLLILNGWNGDGPFGPHTWSASADNNLLQSFTFSNTFGPQSYPTLGSDPQYGALEKNTLFYPYGDSVYRMKLVIPHTGSTVTLALATDGLSGFYDESWGLANFEVQGH